MMQISKDTAKKKIQKQLNQIDSIRHSESLSRSQSFQDWKRETEIIIENIFGNSSHQLKDFVKIKYRPTFYSPQRPLNDPGDPVYFNQGLNEAKGILELFVKEIEEYWIDDNNEVSKNKALEINDIVTIKPNFFGLGLDINALIKKLFYIFKRRA